MCGTSIPVDLSLGRVRSRDMRGMDDDLRNDPDYCESESDRFAYNSKKKGKTNLLEKNVGCLDSMIEGVKTGLEELNAINNAVSYTAKLEMMIAKYQDPNDDEVPSTVRRHRSMYNNRGSPRVSAFCTGSIRTSFDHCEIPQPIAITTSTRPTAPTRVYGRSTLCATRSAAKNR